jgi:ATP-dependent helicase IRC3
MYEVFTKVDLKQVSVTQFGDLDPKSLSLAINTPNRNDLVAATWADIAAERHQRRATIVFALNVEHAHNLASSFRKVGQDPSVITGMTDESVRAVTLQRF